MNGISHMNHHRKRFRNALPDSRLGTPHTSLRDFQQATNDFVADRAKHYSLVVVTESVLQRILLGMKHRGFGAGMYNSFGGKIEPGESDVESACREIAEETGICVPFDHMANSKVGMMRFTFEDSSNEMIVHVFWVDITTRTHSYDSDDFSSARTKSCSSPDRNQQPIYVDPSVIRACDEITPRWFDNYFDIPLDNMFADDSIWLTYLLVSTENKVSIDGWFHFLAGGQATNTILHYYMDVQSSSTAQSSVLARPTKKKVGSVERNLFEALHNRAVRSPTIKEFNEAYAFVNKVRSFFRKDSIDIVIDVAGGHGALAALMLIGTAATSATVIDPANVGQGGVKKAWGKYLAGKNLSYRYECLRTGLPAELTAALQRIASNRILVVACHACQHLSDETLEISCRYGVHAAVMPCCQKDPYPGSPWKASASSIQIPIDKAMDLLLAGKAMSWAAGNEAGVKYDVRMRVIDHNITPQNRIILCRSLTKSSTDEHIERAHNKLAKAYQRAHPDRLHPSRRTTGLDQWQSQLSNSTSTVCVAVLVAFVAGYATAMSMRKR